MHFFGVANFDNKGTEIMPIKYDKLIKKLQEAGVTSTIYY